MIICAIIFVCLIVYVFIGIEIGSYVKATNTRSPFEDMWVDERPAFAGVFWPLTMLVWVAGFLIRSIRYNPGSIGSKIGKTALKKAEVREEKEYKLRVAQEEVDREIAAALEEADAEPEHYKRRA